MLTHYIMGIGDIIQKIIYFRRFKKKEGLQREG